MFRQPFVARREDKGYELYMDIKFVKKLALE